tara:strand:- start:2331 stop:3227 length:897 start_codon:yes stop_codon:yes gene_type:complete
MSRYIVPPSYRAGQGSRVASNVKDALSLMDFLVKIRQQDMAPKIEDARYYARQATEERAQERRDKRLHAFGLEEIKEREKLQLAREDRQLAAQIEKEKRDELRQLAREERQYGDEGYGLQLDKLNLRKKLLADYSADDIFIDDEGWASVKQGALTRTDRAEREAEVFKMSGFKAKYDDSPDSDYQTLWSIFRDASSMHHPTTDVRMIEDDKGNKTIPQAYYPSTGKIDLTPGAFTQGDIAASIKELANLIEGTGVTEEAASNMFHSGLSLNKNFMGAKDYQTYKSNIIESTGNWCNHD